MSQVPAEGSFRPEAVVEVLERHRVDYVVVGGFAARMHGASRPTRDLDVTPSTSRENLDRLVGALEELGARIRTDAVEGGLPFRTSAEALAGMKMLNLVTRYGEVDLTFRPSGTRGYEDLARGATLRRLGTVEVRLAALADVIRSKTAAGRPKDLRALGELRDLAAGRPARPGSGGPSADGPAGAGPSGSAEQDRAARARELVERRRVEHGRPARPGPAPAPSPGSSPDRRDDRDRDERGPGRGSER